ncbi:hypothetical protein WJX81_003382 [Elliptochloris bilobata]|uniref:U-box domain-containing protein n=1 Tax=Elliptochloris bilobata TaxID=381761 RepID=A0AAW1R2G7_9CHLO
MACASAFNLAAHKKFEPAASSESEEKAFFSSWLRAVEGHYVSAPATPLPPADAEMLDVCDVATFAPPHTLPPLRIPAAEPPVRTTSAVGDQVMAGGNSEPQAQALTERVGSLVNGLPMRVWVPEEFLDPVTGSLMLDPVTLLNSEATLDRMTLQAWLRDGNHCCPIDGTPLGNFICVRSNKALHERISAWAALRGINLEALYTLRHGMQNMPVPPRRPSTDGDRRRRHSARA